MKTVKNLIGIVLFISFTFVGCSDDDIEKIPSSEIPDMVFRDYLLRNFDADLDGFISTKEAKNVKEIDLSNERSIYSLEGLEHFTSLEKLNINYIFVGELDVSKNIKLKELYCKGISYAFNLNNNLELEVLDCSDSSLESPDISNNKKLKIINITNTFLYNKSFNFNEFQQLEEFYCDKEIKDLTINNIPLRVLDVSYVENLNITNLPDLELLIIKGNGEARNNTLDLTKSTKLKILKCEYLNCSVDLSNCTVLEELTWASGHAVDLSKNKALKILHYMCGGILDISNNTALETLQFHSYEGRVLSFKNNTLLKNVWIMMKDNENYDFSSNTLIESLYLQGWRNDGEYYSVSFDITNCKNLTELTISMCGIDALELEPYSKLKKVLVNDSNNLGIINAAGLQNLESFEVTNGYSSKPVDADFSNCVNMKKLSLWNIKSLNLTGCNSLEGWTEYPR